MLALSSACLSSTSLAAANSISFRLCLAVECWPIELAVSCGVDEVDILKNEEEIDNYFT